MRLVNGHFKMLLLLLLLVLLLLLLLLLLRNYVQRPGSEYTAAELAQHVAASERPRIVRTDFHGS